MAKPQRKNQASDVQATDEAEVDQAQTASESADLGTQAGQESSESPTNAENGAQNEGDAVKNGTEGDETTAEPPKDGADAAVSDAGTGDSGNDETEVQTVVEAINGEAESEDESDAEADAPQPPALNLCKTVSDEAFKLQSAQGKQQDCWALHRLDTALGTVKQSLPDAIDALGDTNPQLTTVLQSLLAVL